MAERSFETDNFNLSGPTHLSLTDVNWDDAYYKQLVAASLVKGVYVLEKDRQKQRNGPDSLAHHWWEFFHFQLHEILIDNDGSIFGAIFEYKPQSPMCKDTLHKNQLYVIAFRGTTIKPQSVWEDMKSNLRIVNNTLHKGSRSNKATDAVQKMVDTLGGNCSNIWLAGHSLGSSIALHAGKTMAISGKRIESFLFNPPFPAATLDKIIKNAKIKQGIQVVSSVVKAGVATIFKKNSDKASSSYNSFSALSAWIPNLFVNRFDPICSKYLEYFKHRITMEDKGLGKIENKATRISIRSEIRSAFGKDSEPLHLIPSANLTENLSAPEDSIKAHGIDLWWKPKSELVLESTFNNFNDNDI